MAQTVTPSKNNVDQVGGVIIAANADREAVFLVNPHATIGIWVNEGSLPAVGEGSYLAPGHGGYELEHIKKEHEEWKRFAIYGIAEAAATISVAIKEVTK